MKAVIFDLGRVLIHYDHQVTLASTAAFCRTSVEEIRLIFQEIGHAVGIGEIDAVGLHALLAERTGVTADIDQFVEAFAAGMGRDEAAIAYAVELQKRPEVTVGIISNTNEAHIFWLDEHLPELQEIDLVILSSEVGLAKPDRAIYELALEVLNIAPHQAIFVDDLAENVQGAQVLGLAGIVHTDWAITRPQVEAWLHGQSQHC